MITPGADRYTDLHQLVEDYRNRPFEWGAVDCMQITLDWLNRATGVRYFPELKPYTTALGAARVLRGLGYDSLEQAVDAHFTRKEVAFAQRGDLVSFRSIDAPEFPIAVGICCGADSIFPAEKGLILNPTSLCTNVWKVD